MRLMAAVKILCVFLGIAFLGFGYFIYFKRKFNLINGFETDYANGKKNEKHALRVGLIEFVIGIILLATGILLFLF